MIKPPCGECPRKGCGAYHDRCQEYTDYLEQLHSARPQKDDIYHMAVERKEKRLHRKIIGGRV